MDAQARIGEISMRTGVRAMMLDARTERLARWYEQYDFVRFPGQLRMFKSVAAIRKLALRTKSQLIADVSIVSRSRCEVLS